MNYFIFLILAAFLPAAAVQAAYFDYDLAVEKITFSEENLMSGQSVRIYARVHNLGNRDTKGYVSFYHGPAVIDESQIVSVRANSVADEVFIDFVVPDQQFNIRAALQGANPRDDNPANDETMTPLIIPQPDADRDRVADRLDNCPGLANADQLDTDGDQAGNACDEDDDQDGLTDQEEVGRGTNPLALDTDNDGVSDATDVYPLDPSRSKLLPLPSVSIPAPAPAIIGQNLSSSQTLSPDSQTNPPSSSEADQSTAPSVSSGSGSNSNPTPVSPLISPTSWPIEVQNPSPSLPPKQERTFAENLRYFDQPRFIEPGNPRVWWLISALSALALVSLVIEKVQARRLPDLSNESKPLKTSESPATILVPVISSTKLKRSPRRRKSLSKSKKSGSRIPNS